jgi:putative ABC transport system permease protein
MAVMLRPKDPTNTAALEDQITGAMRRVRKLRFGEENDFAINKVDILADLYRKLTAGLYAAMFAVGAISLVVGGIGIMNIMLVSVTERTREIGVRMAIGAKRRFILYQFLVESVALCLAGGVLGVLGGFVLALVVNGATPIPARVQPWSVGLGLAVSSITGMFFGIFPAVRASRLDPIEALRYE